MNLMLSANNTIVYDNMKSKREIITNATAAAIAKKVDLAVAAVVSRALALHASSNAKPAAESPARYRKEAQRQKTNNDAVMENSASEN
jgi:hypothetical protein